MAQQIQVDLVVNDQGTAKIQNFNAELNNVPKSGKEAQAGLNDVGNATKKAGAESNTLKQMIREERLESRQRNFVLRETVGGVQNLSTAFGGSNGLTKMAMGASETMFGLDFAIQGAGTALANTGGKAAGFGTALAGMAVPLSIGIGLIALFVTSLVDYYNAISKLDMEIAKLNATMADLGGGDEKMKRLTNERGELIVQQQMLMHYYTTVGLEEEDLRKLKILNMKIKLLDNQLAMRGFEIQKDAYNTEQDLTKLLNTNKNIHEDRLAIGQNIFRTQKEALSFQISQLDVLYSRDNNNLKLLGEKRNAVRSAALEQITYMKRMGYQQTDIDKVILESKIKLQGFDNEAATIQNEALNRTVKRNDLVKEQVRLTTLLASWTAKVNDNANIPSNKGAGSLGIKSEIDRRGKLTADARTTIEQLANEKIKAEYDVAKQQELILANSTEDRLEIEKKYQQRILDLQYETERKKLVLAGAGHLQMAALDEKFAALKKLIEQNNLTELDTFKKDSSEKTKDFIISSGKSAINSINAIQQNAFAKNIQRLEKEKDSKTKKVDDELNKLEEAGLQESDQYKALTEQKTAIEEEYNAKIRAEKTRAFEADKQAAIIEVAINTAIEISKVLATPWMIAVIAALGALQVAAISSQPTPGFARGTGPEGFVVPQGFSNDSFPIRVSSGERVTVDTPEQQNKRTKGNTTVNIHFNSPVPHGTWVKRSIEQGLRKSGLTIDKWAISNRNVAVI